MTLPIPRAGQSTACAAVTVTRLSAMSTDSIPGIGEQLGGEGGVPGVGGRRRSAPIRPDSSGRSTVKAQRSPDLDGSPVILISSMTRSSIALPAFDGLEPART